MCAGCTVSSSVLQLNVISINLAVSRLKCPQVGGEQTHHCCEACAHHNLVLKYFNVGSHTVREVVQELSNITPEEVWLSLQIPDKDIADSLSKILHVSDELQDSCQPQYV